MSWFFSGKRKEMLTICHTEGLLGLMLTFCPHVSSEDYQDGLGKIKFSFLT